MTMKLVPGENISNGQVKGSTNKLIWIAVFVLLSAAIVANYYYSQVALSLRFLAWIVGTPLLALLAFQSNEGRQALEFIKEARLELRKITWPLRQETVQTTFIIAIMVVVISILLWGLDGVLMWMIGWLTGQRG